MRQTKLLGLCLTVALAVCAIAAAAASAEPPGFEFLGEKSDTLSSKGGALTLETTKGEVVKCGKMTAAGGVEDSDLLPTFSGCTATILTKTYKCKSPGGNEEEIKGFPLQISLGLINKSKEEVGILLSPEEGAPENPNDLFAAFTCTRSSENVNVKIKGSVIGKITPTNTSVGPTQTTKAFEVKFTKGSEKGEQGIKVFEGETVNKLETETSITEKEGKGYVGSAIEESTELFPEVSTSIILTSWLSRENVGGAGYVGPAGEPACIFTAANQKCKLQFKNITNVTSPPGFVVTVHLVGRVIGDGSGRYRTGTVECVVNLAIDAGSSCTDEVETRAFAAGVQNTYLLQVKDPGGGTSQIMGAALRM
jgi:hypothetical protein